MVRNMPKHSTIHGLSSCDKACIATRKMPNGNGSAESRGVEGSNISPRPLKNGHLARYLGRSRRCGFFRTIITFHSTPPHCPTAQGPVCLPSWQVFSTLTAPFFTLPPNAQMAQNAKKYAKKAGGFLGIRANYIIFVEKYHNR